MHKEVDRWIPVDSFWHTSHWLILFLSYDKSDIIVPDCNELAYSKEFSSSIWRYIDMQGTYRTVLRWWSGLAPVERMKSQDQRKVVTSFLVVVTAPSDTKHTLDFKSKASLRANPVYFESLSLGWNAHNGNKACLCRRRVGQSHERRRHNRPWV
jgi:hypothetical protein